MTMLVGLCSGWGTTAASDMSGVLDIARIDITVEGTVASEVPATYNSAGVQSLVLVPHAVGGNYPSGGGQKISAMNATTFANAVVSYYSSHCSNSTSVCPAIEILNEPYGSWFWGATANTSTERAAYAALLNAVHSAFVTALGAGRPKLLAAYGGSVGDGWWAGMVAADANVATYIDGVVVHPYGGTSNSTASALGNQSLVTQAHTDSGLPVWITEIGWPTAVSAGGSQPSQGTTNATGDSLQWSEAQQATNITNFIPWANGLGYVPCITYFNYRDYSPNNWYGVERYGEGGTTVDGSKKPGWSAIVNARAALTSAGPTIVQYAEIDWHSSVADTRSSPTIAWQAGDEIIVMAANGLGEAISAPTATGLTFALKASSGVVANICGTILYSALAGSSGSSTVTITNSSGSTNNWGAAIWVLRNHGGTGVTFEQHTTSKTIAATPQATHSAFLWGVFDFVAAAAGGSVATPTPTNGRQAGVVYGTTYTVWVQDQDDHVGTTSTNFGITSGSGSAGPFSIIGIEVKVATPSVTLTPSASSVTSAVATITRPSVTLTPAPSSVSAASASMTAPSTVTVTSTSIRVRERAPLRLNIDIVTPDGKHARWAPDSHSSASAPADLTFSSTRPGGFEQCTLTLPRDPSVDYPDLTELSTLTARGAGDEIAWQGRLETSPRTSGTQMAVSPGAVGWQAHLDDNKSVTVIYIDRQLGPWQTPSTARQLQLAAGGYGIAWSAQGAPDQSGNPSVLFTVTEQVVGLQAGEMWYAATSLIGKVRAANLLLAAPGWPAAGSTLALLIASDDVGSSYEALGFSSSRAIELDATTARPFAVMQVLNNSGTWGTAGQTAIVGFQNPSVIGDHGLTLASGASGTMVDDGVLASDVVAHAVGKWAPDLLFTTGVSGTIQPSAFVIPQLALVNPTTVSDIVKQATQYELQDWWVDEGTTGNPTFNWAARGTGARNWRAMVGPSGLQETGPQADRIINGVIVGYQDVSGITKTVGPTGSGANTESPTLLDSDPANAASVAGIRKWSVISMGVSTPAGAVKVGQTFLAQQKLLDTSGQAALAGHVMDEFGVLWPAWQVRAGDTVTFTDAHDPSPRRVVKAEYSDASKTCTVTLDSPPDGLQELLERMSISLAPLGFS